MVGNEWLLIVILKQFYFTLLLLKYEDFHTSGILNTLGTRHGVHGKSLCVLVFSTRGCCKQERSREKQCLPLWKCCEKLISSFCLQDDDLFEKGSYLGFCHCSKHVGLDVTWAFVLSVKTFLYFFLPLLFLPLCPSILFSSPLFLFSLSSSLFSSIYLSSPVLSPHLHYFFSFITSFSLSLFSLWLPPLFLMFSSPHFYFPLTLSLYSLTFSFLLFTLLYF